MIKVENYTKVIKGKTILDNVNYTFENGMIYGLYGRNGSGKTMLLRAIAGLIFPTQGRVMFDDKELHRMIYEVVDYISEHNDMEKFTHVIK